MLHRYPQNQARFDREDIPGGYGGFYTFCALTDQDRMSNSDLLMIPEKMRTSYQGSIHAKKDGKDHLNMKEADLLREYYSHLLKQTGGNQKEAARRAGIGYGNFRKRLQKYKIVQ